MSADFTYSKSQEGENSSAYQRRGQPSWISIHFKKIQSFFGTPRRTTVVNLVSDIHTTRTDGRQTFFHQKSSAEPLDQVR